MKKVKIFTNLALEQALTIQEDRLILKTGDNLLEINNDTLNIKIVIEGEIYAHLLINGTLLYQHKNGEELYILKDDLITIFQGRFFLWSAKYIDNLFFITVKKEDNNKVYCRIDLRSLIIEEVKLNYFPKLIVSPNSYLLSALYCIFCYSFENKELWKIEFKNLLSAKELSYGDNLIVIENRLYFYLYDNKDRANCSTFCTDLLTGKILHTYPGFMGHLFRFGNKIGVASNKTARVLDTLTHEIKTYDLTEHLQESNLAISWVNSFFTEESLLYFVADDHRQGSFIGIVDLEKDKLIWLHNVNDNKKTLKYSVRNIQVYKNRLYATCVRDLLVFEN